MRDRRLGGKDFEVKRARAGEQAGGALFLDAVAVAGHLALGQDAVRPVLGVCGDGRGSCDENVALAPHGSTCSVSGPDRKASPLTLPGIYLVPRPMPGQ